MNDLLDMLEWESDEDVAARAADRARKAQGLLVLRDYVPEALEVVVHLENARPRWPDFGIGRDDEVPFSCCYRWGARGFQWQASGGGIQTLTWAELHELIGDDVFRHEVAEWSASLSAVDAWKDRYRPYELWPQPDLWNREYLEHDRARAGYEARMKAWRKVRGLLAWAIADLEEEAGA